MNINNVEFMLSATKMQDFPKERRPHIVFSGKSNVGKSSVINKLLNRKNFARVGQSPGKTVHVNFFDIDSTLFFVDLPGYGFAKVSKTERERWGKIINTYLEFAHEIGFCIQIVDIRHKPSAEDRIMVDWLLRTGMRFVIVANKSDKLSAREISASIKVIRAEFELPSEIKIIPFSAEKGAGVDDVWGEINGLLECEQNS